MPISHYFDTSKKRRILFLGDGTRVDIHVASMFDVELQQEGQVIGRLSFSALSSLNNLEMNPLYLLHEATITAEPMLTEANTLFLAAIQFFREYTNGKFRIAESIDAEHKLSLQLN